MPPKLSSSVRHKKGMSNVLVLHQAVFKLGIKLTCVSTIPWDLCLTLYNTGTERSVQSWLKPVQQLLTSMETLIESLACNIDKALISSRTALQLRPQIRTCDQTCNIS